VVAVGRSDRSHGVYWPVLIAFATGTRHGEVPALRWHQVDLDGGTLWVVGSFEQTRARPSAKAPKSEKGRAVTLPVFATDELRRLKREQAEELFKLGMRQDGDTLLCARADGKPIAAQRKHEFTRLAGHGRSLGPVDDLRHSHATQLSRAGVHPRVAKERLGRWMIRVTLHLYGHVSATMQADTAARMEEAFQVLKSAAAASADSVR
jgi:integrase